MIVDEVDVKSLCVQFGCTSMQPQVESFVQLVRKQVFKVLSTGVYYILYINMII